jgi:hypothetical protein
LPYRWFYLSEAACELRRAHESEVRISPIDEAKSLALRLRAIEIFCFKCLGGLSL